MPFGRDVVFVEDRTFRALGHTRFAVDAVIGVDEQHPVPLVKTVARADDNAGGVLAAKAGFRDDEGHEGFFPQM